jgi:hypothetical protein
MPVIRLILLVTILGGLTLLLAYNWSPALSLKFFGMATQELPLAMWILLGTAAGAATTIFIGSLFGLSNYFGKKPQQNRGVQPPKTYRRQESTPRPTDSPPSASSRNSSSETIRDSPSPIGEAAPTETPRERTNQELDDDDWDLNRNADNWEFDEEEETPPQQRKPRVRNTNNYTNQRESSPESSSTYSYGYQEPKGSSVGKTESIYDADYRVIIPPYPSSSTEAVTEQKDEDKNDNDDDWGIFEEDDEDENQFSDDDPSVASRQNKNPK